MRRLSITVSEEMATVLERIAVRDAERPSHNVPHPCDMATHGLWLIAVSYAEAHLGKMEVQG